jgi:intergrase/recombinase
MSYTQRFYNVISSDDLRQLEMLPDSVRNNAIKSLIVLSKYLGIYEDFKHKLKNHGIKTVNQDSFNSFLRIFNVNNSGNDILQWYRTAISNLRDNEKTLLKYLLNSGIRKEEAIISFNKIIDLSKQNRLNEYYDVNLNCLMHFKYPKEFIRKTKNCFITFINIDLLNEIANSESVSYQALIKRLYRKNIKCRINELRDYFGTFLLQHGILEAEINLCQGRIPPSIFIKHYWSPKLSELRDRIFKALKDLESTKRI